MIREIKTELVIMQEGDTQALFRKDIACNSGDSKPTTGIVNGSTCIEVDTGKVYLFNEATSAWVEV